MEALKAAIGDGVITFLWMFCISTVGPMTAVITRHLELKSLPRITVLLITALLLIFSQISKLLGKASFNPANTAAFYAAGVSKDSLFSMALRFPAQVSTIFL
ncbi:aquaporin SIP1-2-like [Asparagus officinalis]|uniref:aquaporin SIP1-2-like n=1 Tax=Asparagus officinalis TaxID=4686 RepID=UPI00098DF3E2|nr:aquaporin SIP1-2-like [Asparagus officinalis]